MIKYSFKKENDLIKKVSVKGHALFGDYGTDIVCASVSTALIVTANALETLGLKSYFYAEVKEGFFELVVNQQSDVVEALLENLLYTLNELEAQYNTYIKYQKEA